MSKNYHKDGKWIEKPYETVILICICGGKYIKTRIDQKKCLRCLGKVK